MSENVYHAHLVVSFKASAPQQAERMINQLRHLVRDVDQVQDASVTHLAEDKAELERIGYRLAVRRRFPSDAHTSRKAALAAVFPSSLAVVR